MPRQTSSSPPDDRGEVPRVAGELAVARVEVDDAALAIAGDALGVELEDLCAQLACAETERLAHHAADAVAPDDDARLEGSSGGLDDGSVPAGLDSLDFGVLDDLDALVARERRDPCVEFDATHDVTDAGHARGALAGDDTQRYPVDRNARHVGQDAEPLEDLLPRAPIAPAQYFSRG